MTLCRNSPRVWIIRVKSKVLSLQNNEWIENHQNLLITGPTGVGKSYLACSFGQWVCRHGCSVLYSRWPRLLGDILAARGEGRYLRHLQKLAKVKLLIIDDFGLNSLSDTDRKDFLEIIEDRYTVGSTIITSQLPIKEWHAYIGDPTIADAICDRLFHVSHKFEMKGGSMRKKQKNIDWFRSGMLNFDSWGLFKDWGDRNRRNHWPDWAEYASIPFLYLMGGTWLN